jgi:GWxTD domain-containing protein
VQLAIPLQFVVAPGEYTLNVKVSLGEQRDSAQASISAFTEAPLMSDLLVSSSIRVLKEGDSASVAESRKGSLAIQRQPHVVLDASGAKLWYYLELYGQPSQKDSAALAFSVNAPDGKSVLNLQRKLALGDRGRIDAGNIPLIGIPNGSYRLNVQANAGNRAEQRQASFSVAQIVAPPTVAGPAAAGTTNRQLYERYFAPAVRSDSAISELVGALRLAPPGRTFPAFAEKAEAQVQRDALARYFESLDPEPATETHELLDEYVKRLEYVNRQFTEREGKRAGYRTPRGRIFLKYGGPDQSQLIPQGRRMVEVWKYSQQRGLKFVFLDETGFGHYTLVMTNDPNEQSIADWENRIVDADVVRAVLAF